MHTFKYHQRLRSLLVYDAFIDMKLSAPFLAKIFLVLPAQ
jgi:hypothetical protein